LPVAWNARSALRFTRLGRIRSGYTSATLKRSSASRIATEIFRPPALRPSLLAISRHPGATGFATLYSPWMARGCSSLSDRLPTLTIRMSIHSRGTARTSGIHA
jgi:hypothetical protein